MIIFNLDTAEEIPSYLGLDQMRILACDNLLDGSRHEDVALLVHQIVALVRLSTGESVDGSLLVAPILQSLGVDSLLVENGSVVLNDADAGGSGTSQVTAGVQADVSEALK